jgi:hypothetical protein
MSGSRIAKVDRLGRKLQKGDTVIVKEIPATLITGLPNEDQEAILECVGKAFRIAGFNSLGEAEIEFTDSSNDGHTIWLETKSVEKQIGGKT